MRRMRRNCPQSRRQTHLGLTRRVKRCRGKVTDLGFFLASGATHAEVLHASTILSPNFEERLRNLPEAAAAHGIHQDRKNILIGHGGRL